MRSPYRISELFHAARFSTAGAPFPQQRLYLTPEPHEQGEFRPMETGGATADWVCFVKSGSSVFWRRRSVWRRRSSERERWKTRWASLRARSMDCWVWPARVELGSAVRSGRRRRRNSGASARRRGRFRRRASARLGLGVQVGLEASAEFRVLACSSGRTKSPREKSPEEMAFRETRSLPAEVTGPVDACALLRFGVRS